MTYEIHSNQTVLLNYDKLKHEIIAMTDTIYTLVKKKRVNV